MKNDCRIYADWLNKKSSEEEMIIEKIQIRCYRGNCKYNTDHKVNGGYCVQYPEITITDEGCMDYAEKKD